MLNKDTGQARVLCKCNDNYTAAYHKNTLKSHCIMYKSVKTQSLVSQHSSLRNTAM